MADLEVKLEGGDLETMISALKERIGEYLEDRLSEMLAERVQEIHSLSGVWVPRMLKISQVAEILQIPESKARQLTSSADIPRLNLSSDPKGRTLRVDPRDLEAWLAAHQEFPARREELRAWIENSRKLYRIA